MNRYSKYFLNHLLWLDDGFCQYYLQDPDWGSQDILDVTVVVFDDTEEAEQWLYQCAEEDPDTTFRRLRCFLADHCLEPYSVHRMNNRQVVKAAARQIHLNLHRIVIEPRLGWAVQVDPVTEDPILPVSVEPEAEFMHLLDELQTLLNALVADQQKRFDAYEAKMADMNQLEKALYAKKQVDDASREQITDNVSDTISFFTKFYPVYLKTLWKVTLAPGRMSMLTAEALATGSMNPLKEEIDKIVIPVARTYDEAQRYKAILTILLSNPQTHEILWDFSQQYYEATHPIDLARMGAKAATEVMLDILLAIVSAGTVAALNATAKTVKLVKVAKILEKMAFIIKRISPESKMVNKIGDLLKAERKTVKATRRTKKLLPDKKHKPSETLDDAPKREYGKKNNNDGPKTTPKITGDKGSTVNVDGHKIYDPSHPPLSSNPKAQYRFSDPTYRSTGGDVYFGENVGTAFHEVRKNIHGKSLYVGEVRVDNVLDLSDPDVLKKMNIDPAKLTAKVDDVVAQKKVYGYTNQIANQAYDAGYSGIVYPSSRKAGSNAVVLFEGRYDPKAIKPILDISIP